MSLNEEKRMVAEFMGWEIRIGPNKSKYFYTDRDTALPWVDDWNPQSDTTATYSQWAEIWGKIKSIDMWLRYLGNIYKLMPDNDNRDYVFHTAPPSIRWKALCATIKGKGE